MEFLDSISIGIILSVIVVAVIIFAFMQFYRRPTIERSYVRTGFGGQKVIMNSGALVLPILHETIPVNMNRLKLVISRSQEHALITKDPLRVDVTAEFALRVKPEENTVAKAARTLGQRTMNPEEIKEQVEGLCVDALRKVAAEMKMAELHEQRGLFGEKVVEGVAFSLEKMGLELESVSLTSLDQTAMNYFNPENSFDAVGLTILKEKTAEQEKTRNALLREQEVAIQEKDREANQKSLEISKRDAFEEEKQKREIAENKLKNELELEKMKIDTELKLEHAQRDQNIEIASAEKTTAEAWIEANKVKAVEATSSERIITEREKAQADRKRQVELISTNKEAERQRIIAESSADAEKMAAYAAEIRYHIEAAGKKALNEAANLLSNEQISMQVKANIVQQLPKIISESVRPIENIDGIKIMHIDGLSKAAGGGSTTTSGGSGGGGNLSDQVVDSALRYRAQAPLVESLLNEVGLSGSGIKEFTETLRKDMTDKPGSEDNNSSSDGDAKDVSPSNDRDNHDEKRH